MYVMDVNLKGSIVINVFSEHITINPTLYVDIWQLNVHKNNQIKQKIANFFSKLFRINEFFFFILLREVTQESKVALTDHNISAFLLQRLVVFHFCAIFFELIFATKNKNNVVEIIGCFVYQMSKKYCVYYVFEHKILFRNKRILT